MPSLILSGCASIPLAHYLKALGILRLVSEQKDASAKGRWHRDQFVLESSLDREGLLKFFLHEYRPTPVMAPWNGGSGFHPKDNSKALRAIVESKAERLHGYASAIRDAESALRSMHLDEKPTPEQKADLLLLCRNVLPEGALQWLDAAYVLTDDGAKYPPLLGTGGNDGRLEFTNNFMQRIVDVLDPETGEPLMRLDQRLAVSLFADAVATPLSKAPVGQFLPGTAGGANATSGFDAPSAVNPWDFILMIEGALLFASASVKRLESTDTGALAYPFCVRQAGAGYPSASAADETASRAEMWMPVWSQRAVTLPELAAIFSEGRAQVGNRPAKNGVDFARAVVGLGVDRGLDEFQRYGFQVRNGLSYFATPLTRVKASKNPDIDLLCDIDAWLDSFRRAATKDTAPAAVRRALNKLESGIFNLCTSNTPERIMAVLIALGQCEKATARSLKWAKESLRPLQGLRKAWLTRNWTQSAELRLAASLASIDGQCGKDWRPFRCHLEPVTSWYDKERGRIGYRWSEVVTNDVRWSEGLLPDVLNDILTRRLIFAGDTQKQSGVSASLSDIKIFIEGGTNDALLSDLLWSMSLVDWHDPSDLPSVPKDRQPVPPTFYAILKLCFPFRSGPLPEGVQPMHVVPGIHRHAAQGHGAQATAMALRRLRASGYRPAIRQLDMQGDHARRTAASILFPVSDQTLKATLQQTTRPEKEAKQATI
jgi:CRISPR-associated protein Csx17